MEFHVEGAITVSDDVPEEDVEEAIASIIGAEAIGTLENLTITRITNPTKE